MKQTKEEDRYDKAFVVDLPGDGIGPEVMSEVRKVIAWFGTHRGLDFDVSEDLVGGAAYDAHGAPLHDDTMAKALEVDAVLLGAVGGPKYDSLDFSLKPERAYCGCARRWIFCKPPSCAMFRRFGGFSSLKKTWLPALIS